MIKNALLFTVSFLCASSIVALDEEAFKNHLRASLNESGETKIILGEKEASPIPGYYSFTVTLRSNRGSLEQKVFMSEDETKYIMGTVFDLTIDPIAERLKKMDLKNVFSKGSDKAPVTIVEYSDLQCGFCRKAHEALEENLYKEYSEDEVRIIFKHFPLRFHKWAEPGAVATVCAGEQKEPLFWEMIDKFFQNSKEITPENVQEKSLAFAKELDLNEKKFQRCLEKGKALERVQKEKAEGASIGVRSTPTFFVNGWLQRGFRDFESFKPLIDEKLKK